MFAAVLAAGLQSCALAHMHVWHKACLDGHSMGSCRMWRILVALVLLDHDDMHGHY